MAEFVVGVDGGASKTHLALASRDGRLRAFVAGPGTNHEGRGMAPIRRIFAEMMRRACTAAGAKLREVKAGCWGLCGGDLPEDFDHIGREAIRPLKLGGPSLVTNDAFIALFNDRWRDRGIALTSGSWTKWLGMNGPTMFMHDGHGHLGIRTITLFELFRVHENYRKPSAFTDALLRYIGFASYADAFNRQIYGDGKRAYIRHTTPAQHERIRRIPEFLGRRCARGDREAYAMFDRYAGELADGTRAVVDRLRLRGLKLDIVLSGAVLASNPPLRRAYARRVAPMLPRARIVSAIARPIRGALHYAAHRAGWSWPATALREPALWYREA